MDKKEVKQKYINMYGCEPSDPQEIIRIERILNVELPLDFKEISKYYSGGIVGGVSHHSISSGGPSGNIVDETIRIREAISLPFYFVVLSDPPSSLIVMNTQFTRTDPGVIWCDALDASHLPKFQALRNPLCWTTYADFFEYLVTMEVEDRK